jgi:AcrR family transcriptional regulator
MDRGGTSIDERVDADRDADRDADPARPRRADAVKNRQRILDAAAEVFATKGVSVPIDLVAARAGVGVGTLYRHFPNKEALFEAIVLTKVDDLVTEAHAAASAEDPVGALFAFVRRFAAKAAMKHDLFDALGSAGIDIKSRCGTSIEELESGIDRLLSRAAATGTVRDDVQAHEIVGLVVGMCDAAKRLGGDGDSVQRLIDVVCEGLRTHATPA